MKIIKKIFETLLNIIIILFGILIILLLTYVIQTKILKKEYADIFGFTAFQVVSGSMANTINIGDAVIVKLTDQIKENDIIVYKQDNNFITHRVIKIDSEKITTKGDANNTEDVPITKNQVLGKVVKIIPKFEIWTKVFTTPAVFITLILTILLFGIAFSYNYSKEKERKSNEK